MEVDEGPAIVVPNRGHAVLGDEDRQSESRVRAKELPEPLRVDLPTQIIALADTAMMFQRAYFAEHSWQMQPAVMDEVARVVVESDEVQRARLRQSLPEQSGNPQAPSVECVQEKVVEDIPAQFDRQSIEQAVGIARSEGECVPSDAHHRVGPPRVNLMKSENMRPKHAAHNAERRTIVLLARRPLPNDATPEGVDNRLVERDPPTHQVFVFVQDMSDIAREEVLNSGRLPAVALRQPQRQGVVMDRDDGLDAALAQGLEDFAVVSKFFGCEPPLLWLDSAPFEREAVRVVVEFMRKVEVVAESPVMIACRARRFGDPSGLLPRLPVVPRATALDLMR